MRFIRPLLVLALVLSSAAGIVAVWQVPSLGLPPAASPAMASTEPPAAAKPAGEHEAAGASGNEGAGAPEGTRRVAAANPAEAPPARGNLSPLARIPLDEKFDPLDLTPEQIGVISRAYEFARDVRRREEALAERERVLDLARLELEKRTALFEQNVAGARDAYIADAKRKLSDSEAALVAREAEIAKREEALAKLTAQVKAGVADQNAKAAAVYQGMKPKKAAAVIAQLEVADAAAILSVLPDDQRAKIISELDPALAGAILKSPLADEISAMTRKPQ